MTKRKLTRKQIAAIKRHAKRKGYKMPVGSCRVFGGKGVSGPVVVCRRGPNRWELL